MAFRVVVSGNSGDGFSYRIEEVIVPTNPGMHPIVQHYPSIVADASVSGLRQRLQEMLKACDLPAVLIVERFEVIDSQMP